MQQTDGQNKPRRRVEAKACPAIFEEQFEPILVTMRKMIFRLRRLGGVIVHFKIAFAVTVAEPGAFLDKMPGMLPDFIPLAEAGHGRLFRKARVNLFIINEKNCSQNNQGHEPD